MTETQAGSIKCFKWIKESFASEILDSWLIIEFFSHNHRDRLG